MIWLHNGDIQCVPYWPFTSKNWEFFFQVWCILLLKLFSKIITPFAPGFKQNQTFYIYYTYTHTCRPDSKHKIYRQTVSLNDSSEVTGKYVANCRIFHHSWNWSKFEKFSEKISAGRFWVGKCCRNDIDTRECKLAKLIVYILHCTIWRKEYNFHFHLSFIRWRCQISSFF